MCPYDSAGVVPGMGGLGSTKSRLRDPCLQRHLAHSLFSHWGDLCPVWFLSAVWEDTYESLTLQCELVHQTPGPLRHSPIIAPAPWAGRRHPEDNEGPGSMGGQAELSMTVPHVPGARGAPCWARCACGLPGHHMGGAGAHFTEEAPQLWVAGREFAQEGNRPWPPVLLDSSSRCYPPPCRELAGGWVPQAEPPPIHTGPPGRSLAGLP